MNDTAKDNHTSNIEIYQSEDGQASIRVHFENESVWLNRKQLAELFDRDIKTVGKHINNVFAEGELDEKSTVAKFATVQQEGYRQVERQVEHYNLDVIISIGYRVKSKRGTQFRIWATNRLREYLLKGYTLDKQRFEKNAKELEEALSLIKQTAQSPTLNSDEGRGLIEIISRYTQTFLWLQRYDEGLLDTPEGWACCLDFIGGRVKPRAKRNTD